MYQPSLLIVGTRGLSEFKGMLLGSVSKYCLQHSPVPVTVVRPDDKIKKYKMKKNRLSGLMRFGSYSRSSTSGESSSDEESSVTTASSIQNQQQSVPTLEKRMSRLSLMERYGPRRVRSRSPTFALDRHRQLVKMSSLQIPTSLWSRA